MKKLLQACLPFVCAMLGMQISAYSQCVLSNVQISSDSLCVFTTWESPYDLVVLSEVISIEVNGTNYLINDDDEPGNPIRFSRFASEDSLANCDTAGAVDFTGSITYTFLNNQTTCEYKDGEVFVDCPEDVMVSESENCLVFMYPDTIMSTPPDSVVYNDTAYYSQEFDPLNPTEIIYLKSGETECDTMNSVPLNDTLRFGLQVCTYENGILPIVILAFDYTVDADRVQLSWKVNADEPTQRLFLQKSHDGVRWTNVHDQAMTQPSTGLFTTGSFTDAAVDRSRVYYRLYIQGYQGKGNYSNVLPVTLADRKINQVYYQPQSRSIMIKAGKNFAGNMTLINTRGQIILSQEVLLSEGGYVEVQVEGALPAGIYFVRFDDELMPPAKLFIR